MNPEVGGSNPSPATKRKKKMKNLNNISFTPDYSFYNEPENKNSWSEIVLSKFS